MISWPTAFGLTLYIKFFVTCSETSASKSACLISTKPISTCSLVKEGACFNLEKIFSNLFVKFSNIYNHPTPIAPVGEPSLTGVDPLISKSTAKTHVFAESGWSYN